MICSNCETSNPVEAKFCMNCGTSLAVPCSNCGYKNVGLAKFCIECGQPMQKGAVIPVEKKEDTLQKYIPKEFAAKLETARISQSMTGERRIVSILFCDVKGSTEMAENLDPEIWAEIMNQAFEYLISPIYTYEGTLARLMGDSILAFFGAPIAHEDDARRAILAGLEIIKNIQPFREEISQKYNLYFDVRVGINTGLVVVGGVGSDLFMEYTALGDAINIASRMEQTAQPGTIQIGEDTYKQVSQFFDFEVLEEIAIKGKDSPVKAYRVVGLKKGAAQKRGLGDTELPLIGREAELNTLKAAMGAVKNGRGQILCLISESGLGKTRLLKEAEKTWEESYQADQPFGMITNRWNQVSCVSYESSRPYGLVQRLIRNFLGVSSGDTAATLRQNFSEVQLRTGGEYSQEWQDLFEILLGLKGSSDLQQLSGEEMKRRIFSVMLEILEMIAQQAPIVISVDDLQWADSASVEFLMHLFQVADRLPVLFLCSFRPHHTSPAWTLKQAAEMSFSHRYTQVNLSPLSELESSGVIEQLLGGAGMPENVRGMILRKSEGNPFFMEEVVRGLVDEKKITLDQSKGHWQWNSTVHEISIPDNLQSVLTARIDRLDETAKRVLQMASVVGRSFSYKVLAMINDATDELDSQLVNMQRLGLIQETVREPEVEYSFRQALTYETAYNTILLKHRREYHRRVGDAVLQLFPDRIEEFSSSLAHHFYQGQDQRALEYLQMKGDGALRLYATVEAKDSYKKAIEAAKWDQHVDMGTLTELYVSLGRVHELKSDFVDALENYRELENLAVQSHDKNVELTALISQALIYSVPSSEFNLSLGMSIVNKARDIADELDEREALAKLHWISMNLNRFNKSPKDAQEDGEKAIALARELNLEEQLAYSLNDAAHAYSMSGEMNRAREVSLEAVELWERLNNLPMLADGLAGLAAISVYSGQFDEAYQYSDRAYEISQSIENVWGQSYSRYAIGLVDFERGEVDLAIEHFNQAIKDAGISKFKAGELLSRSFLSVAYAELGFSKAAVEVIEFEFDPEIDNLAVTRAFFLGASMLAYVRAENLDKAKNVMEQFRDGYEGGYFIAKYYFVLGKCYFYLFTKDYETALKLSEEFFASLGRTGITFLNPELLLISSIALKNLGRVSEALQKLSEAAAWADRLGSRKTLWQIHYQIGLCLLEEGKPAAAGEHFSKSMINFNFILDHISNPDIKAAFLAKEEAVSLVGLMERNKVLED